MTLPNDGEIIDLFGLKFRVRPTYLASVASLRSMANREAFSICGFSEEGSALRKLYEHLGVSYNGGDFPTVRNKEELQTLVSYMYKHGETLRKPSFSVGDEVWINEHKMVVKQSSDNSLYFLGKIGHNWTPFESLGDANTLYSQIIGPSPDTTGHFPFCRSLTELTTFVDELRRRLKLSVFRSRITTDVASSVATERETSLPASPRRHQIEPKMCVYDLTEDQQRTLVKAVQEAHPKFETLSNWPFGHIGQIWFDSGLKVGTTGRYNKTETDRPISYEEMLSRLKGTWGTPVSSDTSESVAARKPAVRSPHDVDIIML